MAKSIRSKWKRKMRASKRERYGLKELDRLKTMLGINGTDVDMKEEILDDIAIVKDVNDLKSKEAVEPPAEEAPELVNLDEECEPMDDGRRVYNTKTFRDQFGQYPVWLSSRKVKKVAKRNKIVKKSIKKQQKKEVKKKRN